MEENSEMGFLPYFSYLFTIQLNFLLYFPNFFTIQLTFLPYFPYRFENSEKIWKIQKKVVKRYEKYGRKRS
jgi:hypothetical protein